MAPRQDGNGTNGTNGTDDSKGNAADGSDLGAAIAELFDGAGEGDDLGSLLMGQLDGVIESWGKVVEEIARHGVDPTPLLQTLARTLRATADQLDPGGTTT
jgi:hypothetical protein